MKEIKMTQRRETPESTEEIIDRSNLLRAVVVFISKDKNIWDHEAITFVQVGMALGFEREFCEVTVRNILANMYINQNPPVFYNKEYARKFIDIARQIISQDVRSHSAKINFLKRVASVNNLMEDKDIPIQELTPEIRAVMKFHQKGKRK